MNIFTSLELWDDLNFDWNQVSVYFRIIYEIYVKYLRTNENDMKNVLVNSVCVILLQKTNKPIHLIQKLGCLLFDELSKVGW